MPLSEPALKSICPTLEEVEEVESRLLPMPQVACPLTHKFAPGVYLREIFMPKGTFIIGQKHNTEHFNIVLSGKASVLVDGVVTDIEGPCSFVSKSGVRKILYIQEDMRWATVHPTEETDIEKLEATLVEKSTAFLNHQEEIKKLQQHEENKLCLS